MTARPAPVGVIGLVGSGLGLVFATNSTFDYADHLDRRLHDIHCSFIPGAPPTDAADACRAAMYSPYSALLKEQYWGGLPISLFAVGAFAFFLGFSVYLLTAGGGASRKQLGLFGAVGLTPLLVSALMATISATKLGTFCKTCVGIYISSVVLAVAAVLALRRAAAGGPAPSGAWGTTIASLIGLGLATLAPAAVYASSVPDHTPYLAKCGELKTKEDPGAGLIRVQGRLSVQPALSFEDPLCPTCRDFHRRLVVEGIYERLDTTLALFPLDNECNWMLDHALHPGACTMARAVICGGARALDVLEWSYDNQESISNAAKASTESLEGVIAARWGKELVACMATAATKQTLNKHLHFAADNSVPVSTPQLYLDGKRLCDEDIDIGLRFTLAQLAPKVVR